MVSSRLIVLRTLNYLRSTHLPSYVALRLMLESTSSDRLDAMLEAVVGQATIRKHSRILHLKRFKSFDGSRYIYREYFIPAPSTALADSHALAVLHAAGVLRRHADVFSYRPPPNSDYGRNYEHFSIGYKERNGAVAAALGATGSVAVVADLKSFYPTVSGRRAVEGLLGHVSMCSTISPRDAKIIRASAERSLAADDAGGLSGLRIGTEMSHALANMYLSDVDRRIRERFPGRYFRYVDDIVLVVDCSQVVETLQFLDRTLDEFGLERNHDKNAVVDSEEWGQYRAIGRRAISGGGDCWAHLKFRLKLFLARHPEQLGALKAKLEDTGIFLPLEQLLQGAADRVWRDRIADFLRHGWKVLLDYRFDNLSDVVSSAGNCRTEILGLLEQVLDRRIAGTPGSISRRWQVQAARFAINRGLYFADSSALGRIAQLAAEIPELTETSAVCDALRGDFQRLVFTSGPAVAAATQLMALRGIQPSKELEGLSLFTDPSIGADLEAHLALRGFGSFQFPVDSRPPDLRGLATFSRGPQVGAQDSRLGYGAEIAALSLNFDRSKLGEIARTRFTSREDVIFDALSLSSAYAS